MLLSRVGTVGRCDEHNFSLKIFSSLCEIALGVQNFMLGSYVINCTFLSSEDGVNKLFGEFKEVRESLIVHPFMESAFSVVSLSTPLDGGLIKVAVDSNERSAAHATRCTAGISVKESELLLGPSSGMLKRLIESSLGISEEN
jgi:hypothetical protein